MPIDLSQNIQRFEAGDLRQFTYRDTVSVPSCVCFNLYNTDGSLLVPTGVESGVSVTISGGSIQGGNFFIFRQLPSSRGFYMSEWLAYGSGTAQSSLFVREREMFEIVQTEPVSFYSYGNKGIVMRVARQLIGRGDLTEHDVAPHMLAAYDQINARLGHITTVPFSPPTNYIAQGEEIMAIYTLFGTFGATEKGEIPPSFQKLYDNFMAYMTAVGAGEITVDGTAINMGKISAFTGGLDDSGGRATFNKLPFPLQHTDWNIIEADLDGSGWWDWPR